MNSAISKQANSGPNTIEKIVVIIVFALMIIGVVAAWVNTEWFLEQYVAEDHFIEDVTLIPLIIITITSITYLVKFARKKNVWFFLIYLFFAMGSFFVFGEEISWGQRIFGFQSSEYFLEHNTQREENIHNLMLDGERLNKIIFTDALIAGIAVFLIVIPILYKRNEKANAFLDRCGFPIAKIYQIITCLLVFGLSFLTFQDKGSELLEFGGSSIFMLIILFPLNKYALRSGQA